MIDKKDKATQDILQEKPKSRRGRPATGKALSPAEKQKAYRERKAMENQGTNLEFSYKGYDWCFKSKLVPTIGANVVLRHEHPENTHGTITAKIIEIDLMPESECYYCTIEIDEIYKGFFSE